MLLFKNIETVTLFTVFVCVGGETSVYDSEMPMEILQVTVKRFHCMSMSM